MPAIYCKDLYADYMDPESEKYDQVMAEEFQNDWVCPNVPNFKLYGDPWNIK